MAIPSSEEEAELESSKAPLLEHLVELRSRLVKSLIAFLVAFIISFFFAKQIYAFLVQPLADAFAGGGQPGRHMIFTALYETFFTYVKVGMFGAICLAFPYMAAQIWLFIAPGLYRKERKAFLPFLLATPAMFLVGAAFVYYIMMPYAIRFFLSFEVPTGTGSLPIELEARVSEYLSFVMTLSSPSVSASELPVLLTLLGAGGDRDRRGPKEGAALCHRRRLCGGRGGDAARRVQPVELPAFRWSALRNLDLVHEADRETARRRRCQGAARNWARYPVDLTPLVRLFISLSVPSRGRKGIPSSRFASRKIAQARRDVCAKSTLCRPERRTGFVFGG
jgi:sec-independent protein translocase protein TatC